ncbi:MAG: hypothetical protein A2744_03180 [Candidatus Buchananbacteria bacterium RIFCSPHIGHO2_01_FULL_44_11]|uniref:DUF11 domain-containing protein n=1 Tax=Candidatus Buchananbacteria bacterium RIFCSPHIGHO2_01_FULL_44_11 TaxID=1797535 RepID=A0A1G1Y3T2_9BACT|nr:MAG: hypothetical protein A2744_03180 [Candidatus Buchananbacteria bacterium RIFCSPHIGHO2_01_FULL_44_11]
MEPEKLKSIKKEAQRENGVAIHRELTKIYSNKDGSLPDISHLDVKRKSKWRLIILSGAAILVLLAAISWLGFLIFNPNYQFNDQSIEIKIDGPQNIASGDEITYTVNYKNLEKVPLNKIEMIIRYPEGFEFTAATPSPTNNFNSSWQLGTLAKGDKGSIEIKGRLIGEVGSIKNLDVTFSFQPENFSSVFKETASFSSQITTSTLAIQVEGPEKILINKKATYKIKYKNSSDQELANIKILLNYPLNFVFQAASPAPFHKEDDARNLNNQWIIDTLNKNQEGEIEITGGYLADEAITEANFEVQIGFFDPETDEFSLQQQQTVKTQIINQNLSVNLIVAGSSQNQPINFGQNLLYSIVYKNLGQQELDDVEFTITIDSAVLDWEALEDKHGGVVKDNTITWNKDQISELDLVRPLDQGTIDFSIQVQKADDVRIEQTDLQTKSKVTAKMVKIDDLDVDDFAVESNEIMNNINTDIELKVEGRYFDDDNIAVGTGPLPPVVGQKTSFRIYWSIANNLHEVKDVKVTTTLPNSIDWSDKYLVKVGSIAYNEKDDQVTWSIGRIPTNKTFEDVNVWFDIEVTPTKQQERKLLVLTDQSELNAVDVVTESEINKVGKAITSNLEDDPMAGGRGLVIDITE